jgi:dihydroorotate dehydrogenase (fumarate)
MPGASPLADDLDLVRQCQDAGASAFVLHSLFEEQITGARYADLYRMELYPGSAEATRALFPQAQDYALTPADYLKQVRAIKDAVQVPVIASLSGTSLSGWIEYARLIEQAGADALELSIYHVPCDAQETSASIERRIRDIVREVRAKTKLPLAVKLPPYYTSLPNLVSELEGAGADGVVLFNRFFHPVSHLNSLVCPPPQADHSAAELSVRLGWLAVLWAQARCSLALSGGVRSIEDLVNALACGAHAVQIVSPLLTLGPTYLKTLLQQLTQWMETHNCPSVRELQGCAAVVSCPDVSAFERAAYLHSLQAERPAQAVQDAQ